MFEPPFATSEALGLTQGSVTFIGADGEPAQDNANLFWDDTNNFLGVGTATPTASVDVLQAIATSGSPTAFRVTGGAHTTLAASTEAIDADFDFARTVQFATGALATQRAVRFQAPTYGFVAASTISDAATVEISGAPIAGTNATITRPSALWAQGNVRVGAGLDTPAVASTTYLLVQGTGINQVGARNTTLGIEATIHVEGSSSTASVGTRTNNTFNLATNNTNRWQIATTGAFVTVNATYQILAGYGTVLLPAYSFNGNPATGIWGTSGQNDINFTTNGTNRASISTLGNWTFTQGVSTSGSPTLLTFTGAVHTTLAATIEAPDANFAFARNVQFATGALTTQRAVRFQAPTYFFVAASTITTAVAVDIATAPAAGTNTTITADYALRVGGDVTVGPTSAGSLYAAINVPAHTVTYSGTTQVTSAGPAAMSLGIVTLTDADAVTIDTAATLYIAGAPLAAGSVTLTSPYALWVDSGAVRIDGAITQTTDAIATAATVGQTWQNTTAATVGATVQYSPATKKTGHAWKSNATAASQQWDWIEQVRPVTGAAVTTSALHWLSQMDGGGYTSRMNLASDGTLSLGASLYAPLQVRGDYGAAAALYAPYGGAWVLASFGYDSTAAGALKIGPTNATSIVLGKVGVPASPLGGILPTSGAVYGAQTMDFWVGGRSPTSLTVGTDTQPVAGTAYYGWVQLPLNHPCTGIGFLIGTVGGSGTDNVIVALYDSAGTLVANSNLAGTLVGTAGTMQEVAFTGAYTAIGPGRYYVSISFDTTVCRFRAITGLGQRAGSATGTFGTLAAITPPTTTANLPSMYVY